MSNPLFHTRHRTALRHKCGVWHLFSGKKNVGEHIFALTVGNHHGNTFIGNLSRNAKLSAHAASTKLRLASSHNRLCIKRFVGEHL